MGEKREEGREEREKMGEREGRQSEEERERGGGEKRECE